MKISAIQSAKAQNPYLRGTSNTKSHYTNIQGLNTNTPSFKGGKGTVIGAGAGFFGTFLALGISLVTAGFSLPVLAATALMVGGGAAGGAIGDKIGDKLSE